jgi:hypothetical protein
MIYQYVILPGVSKRNEKKKHYYDRIPVRHHHSIRVSIQYLLHGENVNSALISTGFYTTEFDIK